MIETNHQVELLERAVTLLEDADIEVVFIGGATVSLFVDDPAIQEFRATEDVDCVVSATSYVEFHRLEQTLRESGFSERESSEVDVICRFTKDELVFDFIPSDPSVIGFSKSKWIAEGLKNTVTRKLPSGKEAETFDALHMLAVKIEAFESRGEGDFMRSRDFEDIVTILNGHTTIFERLSQDTPVAEYVRNWLVDLQEDKLRRRLSSHLLDSGRVEVLERKIGELADHAS